MLHCSYLFFSSTSSAYVQYLWVYRRPADEAHYKAFKERRQARKAERLEALKERHEKQTHAAHHKSAPSQQRAYGARQERGGGGRVPHFHKETGYPQRQSAYDGGQSTPSKRLTKKLKAAPVVPLSSNAPAQKRKIFADED